MTKRKYSTQFERLKVGSYFYKNGNTWRKRSTRTADLMGYDRWFYFSKNEQIIITDLGTII